MRGRAHATSATTQPLLLVAVSLSRRPPSAACKPICGALLDVEEKDRKDRKA